MRKIVFLLTVMLSMVFAGINFQTASKDDLMKIKGIGEKKAEAIMKYRKSNKIKSADDLKNIKGFGSKLVSKIKESELYSDVKKKAQKKKTDLKDKAMQKLKF